MSAPLHPRGSRRIADAGERIKAIMGEEFLLTEHDTLTYEWRGGYEVLTHKLEGGGSINYAGSYHPNVECEGRGVCRWCGRTLFDE